MKKRILTASIIAAILAVSACGNNAQQTTTAAATTAAPAETTTTAAETTTTTAAETSAEAETEAAPAETEAVETEDNSGKTAIFNDAFGNSYYREDGTENPDFGAVVVPYTTVRLSSGLYIDSLTSPDYFETDEFNYSGPMAEDKETVFVRDGDTIGGYTLKNIATSLRAPWNSDAEKYEFDATEGFLPGTIDMDIEEDVVLTGYVRYYFNEQYGLASGDIRFIPDDSYKGLPMTFDITGMETNFGVTDFDYHAGEGEDGYVNPVYGGGVCIYTDAPQFIVGNLMQDYSDRSDLYELLDGGNADCSKKVEITLSNVHLGWNDNFGSYYSCTGSIKEMKVI